MQKLALCGAGETVLLNSQEIKIEQSCDPPHSHGNRYS